MSGALDWRKIRKVWRETDKWHAFQGVHCGIMSLFTVYLAVNLPELPTLWFAALVLGGLSVLGFRLAWGDLPSPDRSSENPAPR